MMRLISVLAALVLVVTVVAVRPVQAAYLGTVSRSALNPGCRCNYYFEVTGTSRMSITILSVTSKGRLDVEEVLVLDGDTGNVHTRTLPLHADRLIFKVDTPPNNAGVFRIGQAQKLELTVAGHEEVVIDAAP
jgi:hypothetical protein